MSAERLLLKLSGANLKQDKDSHFFTDEVVSDLADQIGTLIKDYEVALVVGGGNIWRGNENKLKPLENQDSHHIGMLATLMNAIVIQNYLSVRNIPSKIFSALSCPRLAEELAREKIERALKNREVVIFAAGTGMPFVSTDTCASIRALEIEADKILIGKNNVKGVYDKDPNKFDDAKFFERISYEELIEKRLGVMDMTAITLLLSKRLKLIMFNQSVKNAFVKAIKNEIEHTEVY